MLLLPLEPIRGTMAREEMGQGETQVRGDGVWDAEVHGHGPAMPLGTLGTVLSLAQKLPLYHMFCQLPSDEAGGRVGSSLQE